MADCARCGRRKPHLAESVVTLGPIGGGTRRLIYEPDDYPGVGHYEVAHCLPCRGPSLPKRGRRA